MTLADGITLSDVAFDARQVAEHLDHTAWSAIAAAEAEIGGLACAQLAAHLPASASGPRKAMVGFALRGLEGALRYGRRSSGARDAAWAIAVRGECAAPASLPPVEAVYDAVLDAIQHVAPDAEPAARLAANSILDEAAVTIGDRAARRDERSAPGADASTPIPPMAFRGLADLPQVAYVINRSLRYVYVNQAWETFARQNDGAACLGTSVIGRSWLDAIGGPDRAHWRAIAEQVLAGETPSYREEIPCHSPSDCRFVVVMASALRLAEDDPEVAGLVFVTYDVTDLRRAESERLWLDQESRRVRDVFLGTVAHDLRSPLTTIKGRAQLLRRRAERAETPLPASFEDSLDAIEATANQMVGQIDELLDVAQAQAGQAAPLHEHPTDLIGVIQDVLRAQAGTSARHPLRFEAPSEHLVGHWDEVRIRRVVTNLLTNAIKYSPDGGEIVVAAWTERDERPDPAGDGAASHTWAAFSVQDRGIGIPAADLPSIFSSFFRGSNVDAGTAGFGLGLAGTHQIVTRHGGRIDVTSEVGVGSTFTVRLPLDE